jgi:hypothetical protein
VECCLARGRIPPCPPKGKNALTAFFPFGIGLVW